MSETSSAQKFSPVKSCTADKKKIYALPKFCTVPQAFVLLQLKILVLMCQYDMVKKSYEPITRFFVRGSFSFIDFIEKEKKLISPPSYFISIVFSK